MDEGLVAIWHLGPVETSPTKRQIGRLTQRTPYMHRVTDAAAFLYARDTWQLDKMIIDFQSLVCGLDGAPLVGRRYWHDPSVPQGQRGSSSRRG